jgi:hypothetical protein
LVLFLSFALLNVVSLLLLRLFWFPMSNGESLYLSIILLSLILLSLQDRKFHSSFMYNSTKLEIIPKP